MNTKTRIQKLESVMPGTVETDRRRFMQEVRLEGNKYFIDAARVDAVTYKKEFAEYLKNKRDHTPAEIITHLSYADGVQ